ncbi:MAG: SH3 domain-containing protein [Helicobacteraceae bacterium]|jgi:uncharacterized protein YgiM (DUF1202 family)|nr:SH3 domain-containing protein [Helicobacteraceae bacterium]
MKKIVCATLLLCGAAFAADAIKAGSAAYVAVKSANVKSGTGFFSSTTGKLSYGDAVTVTAVKGNWAGIKSSGASKAQGWVSMASLTTKKIAASAMSVSTSSDELALAGKGFDKDTEREYIQSSKLDFTVVDQMEKVVIQPKTLLLFLKEGHLAEGGAK